MLGALQLDFAAIKMSMVAIKNEFTDFVQQWRMSMLWRILVLHCFCVYCVFVVILNSVHWKFLLNDFLLQSVSIVTHFFAIW